MSGRCVSACNAPHSEGSSFPDGSLTDWLSFVSGFLAGSNYSVLAARSGEEALQQSKDCKYEIHLLLSDFQMPGMSGIELATQMNLERPQLKIVADGVSTGLLVLNEG
jgi:response regulator RpfG family c-di-GMP phosphodiesterase